MATIVLTFIGSTPIQTQFGLDTFTERYKCQNDDGTQITAAAVMNDAGVPGMTQQHPVYTSMFVTGRYCNETGEKASVLELIYTGLITGGLPSQKHSSGGQVASATTNTDSDIFPATVTNPATVTFYAVTSTLSYISDDPASTDEPDDPPEVDSLITWDLGFGVQPGLSIPGIQTYLLTKAFVQAIIEAPPEIEEIVASGYFYQITKRKTRTLLPYGPAS